VYFVNSVVETKLKGMVRHLKGSFKAIFGQFSLGHCGYTRIVHENINFGFIITQLVLELLGKGSYGIEAFEIQCYKEEDIGIVNNRVS